MHTLALSLLAAKPEKETWSGLLGFQPGEAGICRMGEDMGKSKRGPVAGCSVCCFPETITVEEETQPYHSTLSGLHSSLRAFVGV